MVSPIAFFDQPRIRLLVLTPDYRDFLWLNSLLVASDDLAMSTAWCADTASFERAMADNPFNVLLWDCQLHNGDMNAWLIHLVQACGDKPLVVMGADLPANQSATMTAAGAADYLCRQQLDGWQLRRAVKAALVRSEMSFEAESTGVDSGGQINRKLFFSNLSLALQHAESLGQRLALLHLNIDKFRSINENFGYHQGDELMLKLVAGIRQVLQCSDSILRIGGDELAIIIEHVEDLADISRVVRKIDLVMEDVIVLDGCPVNVNASIGVATYPEAGNDAENLLRQANRAMFEAKQDDGTSFRFYDQQLHISAGKQLEMEADLRTALRAGDLELYYQPRVELATGDVRGVECLLRWNHPRLGMVMPDEFIPLAERSGLIVPIGYWVIDQACQRLRELADLGFAELVLAVNLSFRQFHDRKMTETIFRIIYNANIDTSLLELELTESAMMHDPEYARQCLRELNELGVSFALDDFGTGFSSLSNLQHFPIALVKIDKSFVQGLGESVDSEHIIRAIISLAHSLDMNVVAEGVETYAQMEFLRQLNCDHVQGYYFARPMPWGKLVPFLRNQRQSACL
ncbi:putative bifunctional diguanylate cyclase/phosphodiesterase [Marinobacter sp. BSs20148]|jgi:diguanylate cyclase (GGDEF)-like protein|uniref:putative bifunctional diguanylate cyclase/phosphodiesterase n=1 Tax=Marinobacter sp. BSs20148 TaxID=490759 RepID=UPI0002776D8B|nr:bifunctional diguanylate cyclase/phosphodiesterase [Marinobacter sp. BSs20148]AFP29414.1 sensory box/GGDEF family protein [Marinobacter sp. BSs20148]